MQFSVGGLLVQLCNFLLEVCWCGGYAIFCGKFVGAAVPPDERKGFAFPTDP
jgi:hypothetical protein